MSNTKPSNVVRLDDRLPESGISDRSRSGALLKHCRELASSSLITALPSVMDQLDDALFDLANRSRSNHEQSVYFETMRQVRVKRASIETQFRRFFKDSVRSTIERLAGSRSSRDSFSGVSSADLGLVDENDFEESLAVTNMVRKIRANCKQPLYALERRIAELLAIDDLNPEDNPFGPESMCQAFKDACGEIDADVEVRLIILKLFDRHISAEAERLYCELNDYLVSQGVLPEIRHHVKIQPSAAQPPARPHGDFSAHAAPQPTGNVPPEGAASAWHDPAGYSGQAAPPVGAVPAPPASHVVGSNAGLLEALSQVMDVNFIARTAGHSPGEHQRRVVNELTHLQHGNTQAACEALASFDVSGIHTGTVNVLRELKQTSVANGMGEIDVMMFDVVAMMFDFILDDRKIPAPMKALIGRLQIPMLKVAILDKAFFARKFHPARKVLNTIAEAAVGWSENQDRSDALYEKLESLVERILDEFDEGVEVFAEVQAELESFLEQEESSAESSASAFANAIQGRERLTIARRNAEEQCNRCLEKTRVHDIVHEFIIGHWRELLFVRHFEEGDNGDGWLDGIATMEDLVWSVAPKTLDQDRQHLNDILPGLLRRVRDGMKQVGIPSDTSASFLGALKKLHIAAIRNEPFMGDPEDIEELTDLSSVQDGELQVDGIDFKWSDAETYSVEELSLIQLAIERANGVIYGTAESRPECSGMGTTLVAAQFQGARMTAAHVGDARLYRLRGDVFQRLTADHSLRQQLVNKGIYTAEEVEEKVQSNIITRAVGPEARVDVDVQEVHLEQGDLYLLCSDGLTDMVDDVILSEILTDHGTDLDTASRMLIEAANESGGSDNISVVLARVLATPAPDETLAGESRLEMCGRTDVGRKRSHNEDHIAMDLDHGIAIVADGMGGCNAGEVASEMAVKIILEALRSGSVDSIGVTGGDGTRTSRMTGERLLSETTGQANEMPGAMLRRKGDNIVIEGLGPTIEYEPEQEDEYTERVRNMDVGSWVEFYHVDGSTTRARLTWLSPVTGRYLFTDRKGMKVADSTIHGLAVEMKRGNVAIIEDVPLFDRIIGTIKDHLSGEGAAAH